MVSEIVLDPERLLVSYLTDDLRRVDLTNISRISCQKGPIRHA